MFFYTYVLESLKDKKLYVGWTNNLNKRIKDHNKGLVESTKERRPMQLKYFEGCTDEKKAIKREKYLKTGVGRDFIKNNILKV